MERTIGKLLDTSTYSEILENLTPLQKELFLMFRENFILTMGNNTTSLNLFLAILSLDSSKRLLSFVLKHKYENVPKFLKLIRAPENHVQSGTNKDEKSIAKAISTVEELWKSLHIAAQMIRDDVEVGDKINKMAEEFVNRDLEFVRRSALVIGEDSAKEVKKGRLSVSDKGESFTRMLILGNEYDSRFCGTSQKLINILREKIVPLLLKVKSFGSLPPILTALDKLVRSEAIKEIEELIGHKIDESYEQFIKGRMHLLLYSKEMELWSKLLEDDSLLKLSETEQRLLSKLIKLVITWEDSHEERSFFEESQVLST